MAINMMVVANEPIDWAVVHEKYHTTDRSFEMFPIKTSNDSDGIGVSIPLKYINRKTWDGLSSFLQSMTDVFRFELYDMYLGEAVDPLTYVPEYVEFD